MERYRTRRRATGDLEPTAQRHGPTPVQRARWRAWLPARREVAADATLAEHAAALADQQGVVVSLATRSRAIARRRRGGAGVSVQAGGSAPQSG